MGVGGLQQPVPWTRKEVLSRAVQGHGGQNPRVGHSRGHSLNAGPGGRGRRQQGSLQETGLLLTPGRTV